MAEKNAANFSGKPYISVVIPVYNVGDRLKFMTESLLKQDYPNLEVIFCDDASTDGALEFLYDLRRSGAFGNMRVLCNKKNRGVSFSRNRGFRTAQGEYVITLDADDMIEPNFISSLYEASVSANADYASCGYKKLEIKTGAVEPHPLKVPKNVSAEDILAGRILNMYEVSHVATLYRRSFLTKNNLEYTENCTAGEDMEFLIKMLCCRGKGAFVAAPLYTYVQHEEMGSRRFVKTPEKKLARYAEHTEAQFREAEAVMGMNPEPSKKLRTLAQFMMLPIVHLRQLSMCAMKRDRPGFEEMLAQPSVRASLKSSCKSFFIKPEVFLRSCAALCLSGLYYRHYVPYCDK